MQNKITKVALVSLLTVSVFLTGCSAAWVSTMDAILAAAAPALINILEIVAVAEGKPMNSGLQAKINTDAASIKSLAADFAKASSAAAPSVCSQLDAAIQAYSADQSQVLQLAQVSDPATQTKITLLLNLVTGTVAAITAVIPSCQNAAVVKSFRASKPPLSVANFVSEYNAILVVPVPNQNVNARTKQLKLHQHSKLVRYATFGYAN